MTTAIPASPVATIPTDIMVPVGTTGRALRRVRFDTAIASDESIPGVLAKAAREHVLPRLATIVQGADIAVGRIGYLQLLDREEVRRLAYTLRCNPDALIAKAGERIHSDTMGATHQRVRFGDLLIFRSDLELDRRRIAPLTLAEQPHHRIAWLNRTLPYCPVSLERLVDTCSQHGCGAPLGWKMSWGVGVCEQCKEVVEPSSQAALPTHLADGYRLYAALVSHDETVRAVARASLPARLHAVSYSTIIRLAVRLGLICRETPIINVRQHSLGDLPPETLANVVATGADIMSDWPASFLRAAHARADALRDDRGAYINWRNVLRRLTVDRTEGVEMPGLIMEAMPDLVGPIERSFSKGHAHYLTNEAQRVIGINHERLSRAIDAGVFDMVKIPCNVRRRVQLDKERVDAVAKLVRDTPSIHSLQGRFGLPLTAIEQLATAGLLTHETDHAIVTIREWHCIKPVSVAALEGYLTASMRAGPPPAGSTPLIAAARRIGGREKPWDRIVTAIINGSLPVWGSRHGFDPAAVSVRPSDMIAFDGMAPAAAEVEFAADPLISKDDAGEILNVGFVNLKPIGEVFGLQFVENGRADRADRSAVLAIARDMAVSAEIGAHLNIHAKSVEARMLRLAMPRLSIGWSRTALIEKKILPPLP